jgi:uncharacterized protein
MIITIEQFRARVREDCDGLVAELQLLTGRSGLEEAQAWRSSLSTLSRVFGAPSFQPLHLYFGSRGHLALEYQLPASSSWCDVVLLGSHRSTPTAVIMELKDWDTRGDRPGRYEGLIERQGRQELHPSDQVRGYTEYCRRFHSTVADQQATVHGCVLSTHGRWTEAYSAAPNHDLSSRFPLFSATSDDVQRHFPGFFEERLTHPDSAFADAFEAGRYRQDRGFVAQIGAQILDPESTAFELLDNQRAAFALCRAVVNDTFVTNRSPEPPRTVVIIKGPPGCGKSAIAARLWASLVTDPALPDGDVVFTTTSMSQHSNWSHLFDRVSDREAARGVVRKATTYCPISLPQLNQLRARRGRHLLSDSNAWRENLATLRAISGRFRDGAGDGQNLITIVDEAHALINPEDPRVRGQFGFVTSLGPQAYHIIRSSVLTVFLLDPQQAFRQRENTSLDDLREWARELGAGDPEEIGLEGIQFRCAGSPEFVAWLDSFLKVPPPLDISSSHRRLAVAEPVRPYRTNRLADRRPRGEFQMDLRVFDSPEDLEAALRQRQREGHSVRFLSTFSRPWKSQGDANAHALPPDLMDFHEPYEMNGETRYWSRVWNVLGPRDNYAWYVTGHPAGKIAHDPLCEVGCTYAVRGFDYDFVGILWLNDLIWRDTQWRVDPNAVAETGVIDLVRRARKEAASQVSDGPATSQLLLRVAQAYRILFTRALKGAYVWVPDAETRSHLESSIH